MSDENYPIVSAAHLASPTSLELSEFEFGLTIANNSFQRWMLHCSNAAGLSELTPQDVLIIHHINHRGKAKRIADIGFILNQEDTHTISYSVRKLTSLGLVEGKKQGKEIFHSTTEQGADFCQRYREVREACLIKALKAMNMDNEQLGKLAEMLRTLSGVYDQASRAAASL